MRSQSDRVPVVIERVAGAPVRGTFSGVAAAVVALFGADLMQSLTAGAPLPPGPETRQAKRRRSPFRTNPAA